MSLTEVASRQIQAYLNERGGGLGIRVIVQSSECSGMAYRMVFVDRQEAGDAVFASHGTQVYVDPKSLVWLAGTVIDFVQEGQQSGFSFSNPNVRNQCGCGESFYV